MSMRNFTIDCYGVNVSNVKLSINTKFKALKLLYDFDREYFYQILNDDKERIININSIIENNWNRELVSDDIINVLFNDMDEYYEDDNGEIGFWSFFCRIHKD